MSGQTVTYRPKKIRWIAGPAAAVVVVLFTALSFGLRGSAGFDNAGQFERGDQTAMIGLGVLIGLGILAFCRPRVVADAERIRPLLDFDQQDEELLSVAADAHRLATGREWDHVTSYDYETWANEAGWA